VCNVCVELVSVSQILCVSSLLCHVMYTYHSLFCGLCCSFYIKYICVLSTLERKHLTKNSKKLSISIVFLYKARFIDSATDKMIISTDLSVISAGLPVKADFQPCRN
jgi:hypothetical protein